MDKLALLKEFRTYTDSYDSSDPKVALKIEHTYRVADIAEEIARSIPEMDKKDVYLCWLLGLLHDIGRFEQLKRYGTFLDSKSIDHAELGADILFKDGVINRFWRRSVTNIDPEAELDIIEYAIRQHNKLSLPEELPNIKKMFSNILRDADKIDIFRVVCETPYDVRMTKQAVNTTAPARTKVMQCVREHRCVPRLSDGTEFESRIAGCAMAFELVYPKSRELVTSQGFLNEMLSYEPPTQKQKEQMEELRRELSCVGTTNFCK